MCVKFLFPNLILAPKKLGYSSHFLHKEILQTYIMILVKGLLEFFRCSMVISLWKQPFYRCPLFGLKKQKHVMTLATCVFVSCLLFQILAISYWSFAHWAYQGKNGQKYSRKFRSQKTCPISWANKKWNYFSWIGPVCGGWWLLHSGGVFRGSYNCHLHASVVHPLFSMMMLVRF